MSLQGSSMRWGKRAWRAAIGLLGAAALCVSLPAFGANLPAMGTNAQPLVPGTLSYMQGTVLLDGNQLAQGNVGKAEISPGQVLRTREGRAEVMLDPGVYLRLDNHTEAKVVSMAPTRIAVEHGEIGIEVDSLADGKVLQVIDNGVTTQLVKNGYYEFNANSPMVKAFSGQAEVHLRNGAWKKVGARHEMVLADASRAKPKGFQPNPAEEPMMAWSKERSEYLSEMNRQNSPSYAPYDAWGPGWGPGLGMGWGWGMGPAWGMGPGWGMGWGMGWGW